MATQLQKLQEATKEFLEKKKDIERTLYYDDFVRETKKLADFLRQAKESLETAIATDREAIKAQHAEAKADLNSAVAAFEKKVDVLIADLKQTSRSEARLLSKMFNEAKSQLEDLLPEEYDDTPINERIAAIEAVIQNLPPEFDPSDLNSKLETYETRIKALEQRPTGTGGAMTDRSIQYALSRVVKTETPTGTINGSNTDFYVSGTIHAVLSFELNSRVIDFGTYSIVGSARKLIRFDTAPSAAYSDSQFNIVYV